MKLSEWARANGVSRQTATRWFHAGVLPAPARQLATGTVLVDDATAPAAGVAIHARVSSGDQRGDPGRRVARPAVVATERGLAPTKVVAEVGSGPDGHRAKLLSLLGDPAVGVIVVEHRDRLARFGAEYPGAALAAQGRRVVVVEEAEVADEAVRDMAGVPTGFCARPCGRRSARRGAEAAPVATQGQAVA
ncbi:MAG: IS607 family transposase [Acidimicrobiales bacterium]